MTTLSASPSTVFASPDDRTAPEPPELRGVPRDGVRLLVARPDGLVNTTFSAIGEQLRPGDVVVVNTSATIAGQLTGRRGGAAVVVHVANRLADGTRVVELRTAPAAARPILDASPGEVIEIPAGGTVELLAPYPHTGSSPTGRGNRLWRACIRTAVADQEAAESANADTSAVPRPRRVSDYLNAYGRPISYGYLRRSYPLASYQTIFALHPGSAEMPSAARPFTTQLVTRLVASGVVFAPLTLHTGVSSQEAREAPQEEWFSVSAATANLVNAARDRGNRIVAVGTTATRALESATRSDGVVEARTGWTDLVISADRPVRTVSGLVTGWHNPEASHLLLVESVAGAELTQRAYDEAVRERYLWHEFGDSCLLLP